MTEKKLYRVRETFKVKGWTYVMAESEEKAQEYIENGDGEFKDKSEDWYDTDWSTLGEAPKRKKLDL